MARQEQVCIGDCFSEHYGQDDEYSVVCILMRKLKLGYVTVWIKRQLTASLEFSCEGGSRRA